MLWKKVNASGWACTIALCAAVSLLVDFVVQVLMDVISVALLGSTNVLSDPDNWSGLCDGDDDLGIPLLNSTWAGR